jgi:hypothetical protein
VTAERRFSNGEKLIENPGLKTFYNQGHYNTLQAQYFFNTALKVSSVPKYPLYKNTCPGGIYND